MPEMVISHIRNAEQNCFHELLGTRIKRTRHVFVPFPALLAVVACPVIRLEVFPEVDVIVVREAALARAVLIVLLIGGARTTPDHAAPAPARWP